MIILLRVERSSDRSAIPRGRVTSRPIWYIEPESGRSFGLFSDLRNKMPREIQRFDVGLKAFVMRRNELLVVRESATGLWELPGGRIDVGEEHVPQTEVLARELREELGEGFRVAMGPLAATWIRRRPTDFVFLVGRLCRHVDGEPSLSHEHDGAGWVDERSWRSLALAPGYPEGIEEFWRRLPALARAEAGDGR
jgi:ADP-ribose pyrophosphatase YjhB (NUDIX family)